MEKDEALDKVLEELQRKYDKGQFYTSGDCYILIKDLKKFVEGLKTK